MKLLSFTVLIITASPAYAVEFSSCTDSNGKTHFTNLPASSLDDNCIPKNHYTVMLEQDYQKLPNEFEKYKNDEQEVSKQSRNSSLESFDLSKVDISPDSIKSKVHDIFNPDKALEELMNATEDRDDIFTRAIRGRSEGIQNILNQAEPATP